MSIGKMDNQEISIKNELMEQIHRKEVEDELISSEASLLIDQMIKERIIYTEKCTNASKKRLLLHNTGVLSALCCYY